jgi:competence protein ComEA
MKTSRTELVRRAVDGRVSRERIFRPRPFTTVEKPPSSELARARWQVWAPLGLRVVALAVALLGLAGIGSVAAHAPRSAPPAAARAALGLASLAGPGLAGAGGAELEAPPAPTARAEPPATETPCPTLPSEVPDASGRAPAVAERAPVALNRANAEELQRLPGVGAKRASAILALRQRLGRFQRKGDLLRVKGIGPRTLERMLPHVVLD